MSKSTLQRYESGYIKNIPLDKLEVLSEALNVTPQYIMGIDEPSSEEIHVMAAHHDSDEWTEEELTEIENFKKYVLSKRK